MSTLRLVHVVLITGLLHLGQSIGIYVFGGVGGRNFRPRFLEHSDSAGTGRTRSGQTSEFRRFQCSGVLVAHEMDQPRTAYAVHCPVFRFKRLV